MVTIPVSRLRVARELRRHRFKAAGAVASVSMAAMRRAPFYTSLLGWGALACLAIAGSLRGLRGISATFPRTGARGHLSLLHNSLLCERPNRTSALTPPATDDVH